MKRQYWGTGLAALLTLAFVLVQPTQVTAQYESLSDDDVIAMIEEHTGDLSPEDEQKIRDQLEHLREQGSNKAQTSVSNVTVEGIPEYDTCSSLYINLFFALVFGISNIPEDGISMTTVRNGNIIKTTHAEKEVFSCATAQGGLPITVDITVFGEVYENISTKSIINKNALVVTCVKEGGGLVLDGEDDDVDDEDGLVGRPGSGQVLGCQSAPIPTGPVPVRNCIEAASPIITIVSDITGDIIAEINIPLPVDHPQEMNTVNKGNIVKTIEAQKEIFICNLDFLTEGTNDFVIDVGSVLIVFPGYEKKVDIVTFTEIWEDLSLLPANPVVKKEFLVFRCVVGMIVDDDGDGTRLGSAPFDLDLEDFVASVESCQFSAIQD
ncbi:MAG: hypothetical protein HMLIMOIP_000372 [Candidatus Nitrosomirales archaeon]|jgi:hypothetical protein